MRIEPTIDPSGIGWDVVEEDGSRRGPYLTEEGARFMSTPVEILAEEKRQRFADQGLL